MKKTTLLQAQGSVDTMYDVDLNAVSKNGSEGFRVISSNNLIYIMYGFILLLLLCLFTQKKASGKMYIVALASLILVITIWYR